MAQAIQLEAIKSQDTKSQVVSIRLHNSQMERLRRLARRLGRTPSETSALLVEEALRRAEFGLIEFRDSPVGRQAYVQGSRLAVWQVAQLASHHNDSAEQMAAHLAWPVVKVQAALSYAKAFPEEIATAMTDNDAYTSQTLSQMLPQTEVLTLASVSSTDLPLQPAQG